MLSQEGEEALSRLAEGQILNPVHTTARELITAGLACNDWGHLALTEAGRVRARRRHGGTPLEIMDEHVCDMSQYLNPMGLGREVPVTAPPVADFEAAHAEIAATIVRPASYYDRATRAAGVASGKTGVWPEVEWVHAFMEAFDETDK